jgi:YfiH family protein
MVDSAPSSSLVFRGELLSKAGFRHGFSKSANGADFALGRDKNALEGDIFALAHEVGFDAGRLFQVKQVHGTTTHLAEGDPAEVVTREGDAVLARDVGAVAGVRVADCVPVLVASESTGACAAIHAGWRGVEQGIVGVALGLLGGTDRIAAIGPCIGPCCFEVSSEVASRIADAVAEPTVVTSRYGEGKAKVDLRRAVRAQLRASGLSDSRIEDVGGCSMCGGRDYHSFRRDGDASGRMLAVIVARSAR